MPRTGLAGRAGLVGWVPEELGPVGDGRVSARNQSRNRLRLGFAGRVLARVSRGKPPRVLVGQEPEWVSRGKPPWVGDSVWMGLLGQEPEWVSRGKLAGGVSNLVSMGTRHLELEFVDFAMGSAVVSLPPPPQTG